MNEQVWMDVIVVEMLWCVLASLVFVIGYLPVKRKLDAGKHMMRTSALFAAMFAMTVWFQYRDVPLWFLIAAQVVVVGATAVELTYRVLLLRKYRRLARQRARDELAQRRQAAPATSELSTNSDEVSP